MHRWTSEPEDFLKKHQKELANKKLALFVCCGSATDNSKPEAAKNIDGNIWKKNQLSTICILLHWGFSEESTTTTTCHGTLKKPWRWTDQE